ncbi:hypothetical protein RvY_03422 [Ramazzottius varieornatus]|uniref:GPN-loop GTPase n=1 Tax=Ramazzottius varieornatus TaxID=947166 RepID=A0A1D1UXE1_RAMVA|nr:hypothetical protein RvY_03422 [Ramazzottius varieornatus]
MASSKSKPSAGEISSGIDELAGAVAEKCNMADAAGGDTSVASSGATTQGAACLLVLGMAGSGKTTFVEKIQTYLTARQTPPYVLNLDPAVRHIPYQVNIDIRDSVNYKNVMKKFGLGPNGGIITSLNLFTTKFSGVLELLEKRKQQVEYMVFDTPGQIEVFTWSASGAIITEALADAFPTVVVYVMDVLTGSSPITFMSNMLYACSILYKSKLPFVIALNKVDLIDPTGVLRWITDFEAFDLAVEQEKSYAGNLSRSLGLILEEFYGAIKTVPVSARSGEGLPQLFKAVNESIEEYNRDYKPELEKMKEEQRKMKQQRAAARLERLKQEVLETSSASTLTTPLHQARKEAVSVGVFNDPDEGRGSQEQNGDDDNREEESFKRFLDSVKKGREKYS